jgi:hypothetical protein
VRQFGRVCELVRTTMACHDRRDDGRFEGVLDRIYQIELRNARGNGA